MSTNRKEKNILFYKIKELDYYLNEFINPYEKTSHNIQNFLKDLKKIAPNLSILAILNNLVEMHQEGFKNEEIIQDIHKTKRIFLLIDEYIKFLEEDDIIKKITKEIHFIIDENLEKALELFLKEFKLN